MRSHFIVRRGSATVFVSLVLSVFLILFQTCYMSAQGAYWRSQMQAALELTECSVLSEYHRGLLEMYDLFYLDLGYGRYVEDTDYLEQRIRYFLDENLSEGEVLAVKTGDFSRATDECGLVFYEQAVAIMKSKSGVSVLEKFQTLETFGRLAGEKEHDYKAADAREKTNLEELKRRREEEEQVGTADPTKAVAGLKGSSVLHLVVEEPERISVKAADISRSPSVRTCLAGNGPRGKEAVSAGNDALFLAYLQEYLSAATDFLAEKKEAGAWMDYQLEYVIAGKDNDCDNLEHVCGELLALREGINYAYLLTDGAKVAECEAMAAALVGITLIPGLIEAMKHVLLLTWAFAESVMDVRALLEGNRVAFLKENSSWRLSLSNALDLGTSRETAAVRNDASGLSYREYLGILLTLSGREKKVLRCLDVIEGVIGANSSGSAIYLDQCVDWFSVRVITEYGKEWSALRSFGYEW